MKSGLLRVLVGGIVALTVFPFVSKQTATAQSKPVIQCFDSSVGDKNRVRPRGCNFGQAYGELPRVFKQAKWSSWSHSKARGEVLIPSALGSQKRFSIRANHRKPFVDETGSRTGKYYFSRLAFDLRRQWAPYSSTEFCDMFSGALC